MKNTRSIKELLQVMLDNIENLSGGLCSLGFHMMAYKTITSDELQLLLEYIIKNRPYNLYRIFGIYKSYYWKPGKIKPRLRWLKRHIKKNS